MRAAILFAIFLTIPVLADAQTTWYVPDDFPTIQGAISDASVVNGDTIIIRPGTYVENIDFLGKAITVKSESGPGVTIIDGNKSGSVVTFQSGEGLSSVLDGFTMTNGTGNEYYTNRTLGGGICCRYNSSPTISNNIIKGNSAFGLGGGICCYVDASPTIMNNIIFKNQASDIQGSCGGGICCIYSSSPIVLNNEISKNSATSHTMWNAVGGGIACLTSSTPTITNNTITENAAFDGGDGIYCSEQSSMTITNTILWNKINEIYIGNEDYPSSVTISNSAVEGGQHSCIVESGCTLNWGDGMIDSDPLFVDPANDDFHITWVSPCINRGTNDGAPSEDFDGDPRPYMGTVDMGADEFVGTHPLAADVFSVSEGLGGSVNFTLTGGVDNSGRNYILLGGVTETAPGTTLPGSLETLRLNWDVFTDFVVSIINTTVFMNFLSTLDTSGMATAQLNAPPIPGFAGVTMHYAYALNNPWDFVSNPVQIDILP